MHSCPLQKKLYNKLVFIMHLFQSLPVDMLSGTASREVLIGPDPPTTAEEGHCGHLLCQLWPFRRMCRLLFCRSQSRHSETSRKQMKQEDNERALLKDHESDERHDDSQSKVIREEIHQHKESSHHKSPEGKEHGSVAATPSTKQNTAIPMEAEKTTYPVETPSTPAVERSREGQQDEITEMDEDGKQWKKKSLKRKWSQQKKSVTESLWFLQFIVLLHRTFKRSRRRLLTKMVLFQASYLLYSCVYCVYAVHTAEEMIIHMQA